MIRYNTQLQGSTKAFSFVLVFSMCLFTGDDEFAEECHTYFLYGQEALDRILWNETARYYNAYEPQLNDREAPDDSRYKAYTRLVPDNEMDRVTAADAFMMANSDWPIMYNDSEGLLAAQSPRGALMTDTFYAQVKSPHFM